MLLHVYRLVIYCLEQGVPELGYHIELLKHGYHVANVAKIVDTQELISLFLLLLWLVVELLWPL